MGLLYLLHNPNLEDPISDLFSSDMTEAEFRKKLEKVMQGDIQDLLDDGYDIEQDAFKEAQEAFNNTKQCEWDVLAEASKVGWAYTLEQEPWKTEIEMCDDEAYIHMQIQIENNRTQFQNIVQNATSHTKLRTNYAYGKSSLHRCNSIATPYGLADALNYVSPNKDTVLSWCALLGNATNKKIRNEEDMDCTPPGSSVSHVPTEPQSLCCSLWQPFYTTDGLGKRVLRRTLSF